MGRIIARLAIMLLFTFLSLISIAQEKVEMADSMRSNGKIYVVVAVALTILAGLFFYLFLLDRKITRFEKNDL